LTEKHITLLPLCRFQGTRGAMLHNAKGPRLQHARSFKTEQRYLEGARSNAFRTRSTYFQVSVSTAAPTR